MHSEFTPLAMASPAMPPPTPQAAPAKVLGGEEAQSHFQPLLAAIPPSPPAVEASASAVPPPQPHEPRLDVQREGDRITQIRIQCSCGQLMEIKCQY